MAEHSLLIVLNVASVVIFSAAGAVSGAVLARYVMALVVRVAIDDVGIRIRLLGLIPFGRVRIADIRSISHPTFGNRKLFNELVGGIVLVRSTKEAIPFVLPMISFKEAEGFVGKVRDHMREHQTSSVGQRRTGRESNGA